MQHPIGGSRQSSINTRFLREIANIASCAVLAAYIFDLIVWKLAANANALAFIWCNVNKAIVGVCSPYLHNDHIKSHVH